MQTPYRIWLLLSMVAAFLLGNIALANQGLAESSCENICTKSRQAALTATEQSLLQECLLQRGTCAKQKGGYYGYAYWGKAPVRETLKRK